MKAMLFAYKMIYCAVNQFYVELLKVNLHHLQRERETEQIAVKDRQRTYDRRQWRE